MPKISIEFCVDISEEEWLNLQDEIADYGEEALAVDILDDLKVGGFEWLSVTWKQDS